MKKCITCDEEKEFINFSLGKNQCKRCSAKRSNKWYWENKEYADKKRRKYYQDHREDALEKCKKRYWEKHEEIRKKANERNRTPEEREKSRIRTKEWKKNNKEKVRKQTSEWKRNNPEKAKAHQYVLWGLRLNVIQKPNECQNCGKKIKLEAHHKDYSKPLEVNWLCKICHEFIHHKDDYVSSIAGK